MPKATRRTAWVAVGRFLYTFAKLEGALNHLVMRLLDLQGEKGKFLAKELDLNRKLKLIEAAIAADRHRHTDEWVREAVANIQEVRRINAWRVIFAHQPFEHDGTGGLSFDVSLARDPPNRDGKLPKAEVARWQLRMRDAELAIVKLHDDMGPVPVTALMNLGFGFGSLGPKGWFGGGMEPPSANPLLIFDEPKAKRVRNKRPT